MRVLCLTFILLGVYSVIYSQALPEEKTSFSLKEAIDFAMEKNFTVKNSALQRKMSNAKKNEVKSILLPQVSANVDYIHSFQIQKIILERGVIPLIPVGPGQTYGSPVPLQLSLQNQLTPSINASQVLFDQSYFSGVGAAKVSEEIAERNVVKSKIDIAVNVTKAYYAVLVNEKQLYSIEINLERLDSVFKETQSRFTSGLARKIDVSRIEVSLNNLKEEREKVNRTLELSRNVLRYQINTSDDNPLILTDSLHESLLSEAEELVKSKQKAVYANRIEYSIIQRQERLNKYDLNATRAALYPNLIATAATGFTPAATNVGDLSQGIRWVQYSNVGLKLHVPIFSGNAVHHRIQQKKIEDQILKNNKLALEKGINLEVDQSLINLQNSLESIRNQKRNLVLAEENLQVLKAEYNQGIALNIEVTTAEAAYIEAQTNYFNSLYGALLSKVDYDKAMGNIK